MALARITDDVLFVIIDALKIEDIILLGATARRLRTATTNEDLVQPADSDQRAGARDVGLDAAACASLASLGCTPRRLLCVLPSRRPNRDRASTTQNHAPGGPGAPATCPPAS